MQASAPVIIAVAPNGARKTRADHPRVPITPAELADCAEECLAAGASMLHLHVRDSAGAHSLDPDAYCEAIATIRQRVGDELILQVTSESAGIYAPHEQMATIEALRPEAVSLAVREFFATRADEMRVTAFLHSLAGRSTLVQYIVYGPEDLRRCVALHSAGVLPQRHPNVLFVLGSYAEQRAGRPRELSSLLAHLPDAWTWSVCAFGAEEARCVVAGALLGGDIRVGFENNMQLPWGQTAASNAALVQAAVDALSPLGLRPATCTEARRQLRSSCA